MSKDSFKKSLIIVLLLIIAVAQLIWQRVQLEQFLPVQPDPLVLTALAAEIVGAMAFIILSPEIPRKYRTKAKNVANGIVKAAPSIGAPQQHLVDYARALAVEDRRDAILQKFEQRLKEQYQGLSFGLILLGFAVHLASELAKGALTHFEAGIISLAFVIYVAVSGFGFWEKRQEKIWQEVINV